MSWHSIIFCYSLGLSHAKILGQLHENTYSSQVTKFCLQ